MITNSRINKLIIVVCITILLSICFFSFFVDFKSRINNKLYPRVYIDNVNVGYKTKQEVQSMYQGKNSQLNQVTVMIIYKENPIATFSSQLLNLHYNVDDIYEKAFFGSIL